MTMLAGLDRLGLEALAARHADRLRSGASGAVLPFAVTAGTFLRSVRACRQLDKAAEHALARAWSVGAAPAVAERISHEELGYHPLVARGAQRGEHFVARAA